MYNEKIKFFFLNKKQKVSVDKKIENNQSILFSSVTVY